MIYVSSSCIKNTSLENTIRILANKGFKNIELSGGTNYQEDALETLIALQKELNLNFLLHNYFPTPKTPFVLNLASLDKDVLELSMENIKKSIDWSHKLGATKFAFHAGFLINIPLNQIGKKIEKKQLFNENEAYTSFNENLLEISQYNDNRVNLYIENNVLSKMNYEEFGNVNPFFFTDYSNLNRINLPKNMNILLDVAHLKVSCNSLSLNFEEELKKLYNLTDYVHISDNNGQADTNKGLVKNSSLYNSLEKNWDHSKTYTIEVYSGIGDIEVTNKNLENLNTANDKIEV